MRKPSVDEVAALADELSITLNDEEADAYTQVVRETLDVFSEVESRPTPRHPPREYSYRGRTPGYQPTASEDPHNAWITRCRVEGAETGPLTGMTVGLKDNVSLAGIELTNGSRVMEGYVPACDATIVTRLLEAGATITGKTNLWSFSSGAPEFGHVRNPRNPEYSVGHSSSGSTAAVAAGEVDIGIGSDQGGSVRMPASFAGVVGLKPTYGLIPYTGIFGADPSLDHVGPLTRSVEEAALVTEVLAGRDGLDPRQPRDLSVRNYVEALQSEVSELTVAVLSEGFDAGGGESDVTAAVADAVETLADCGVEIQEVSVPMHDRAGELSVVVALYGMGQLFRQHGLSPGFDGWYDTGAIDYVSRALAARSSDLPATVTHAILVSEFLRRNYGGSLYAKAKNLTLQLRAAYDDALADADALVMPTVPMKPPAFGSSMDLEKMRRTGPGFAETVNTEPFNLSHHPALSVPCATVDDVPVGAMFVASHFDEPTLFALGAALERQTEQ
ncbi:amidase [Haloarcula sp. S1CR25-12]|uniref:Amidase n=1 Tax=Haloarcula saliterrae TaxID=2950534 RepID=A0ABU2FFW0_9EURY|nr:amidase [Haloarcula sp. S1CR25-12]MDS0261143.1 amidase [Haloarcula sp. S1CR25-12]